MTGLIAAMLLYNLAVVATLASAGIGLGLADVTLWPATILTRRWPSAVLRAFKRRLLRERKTRRVVWHMLSGWKALKREDAVFQGEEKSCAITM
jgi:hypothetical protein